MALRPPAAPVALPLFAVPLFAVLLGSASGCDPEAAELRDLDLGELSERFACDDVTLVAANVDGSEALLIGVEDGLVAAASVSTDGIEAVYDLPDPRLTVRWVAGTNVYDGHCGRDGDGEWQLDSRTDAVAGTLTVRLTPTPEGTVRLSAEFDELLLAPSHDPERPIYALAPTRLDGVVVD